MARIYRCDRCNNEIEDIAKAYVMTLTDRLSNEVGRQWDLCVWCKNALQQPFDSIVAARTA